MPSISSYKGAMPPHLAVALTRSRVSVARAITLSRKRERVDQFGHLPVPLAFLAPAVAGWPSAALAHATERGFVLLLPTGYYLAGGTATVAVSFLLLFLVPGRTIHRIVHGGFDLCRLPGWLKVAGSAISFALTVALIVAGFTGTADPLANPLPLAIWTLWFVCLTIAHAIFGNLWVALNPWTAPLRLLYALGWRRGVNDAPLLRYPERLGCWPAVALFLGFAWFELIDIAPGNPPRLAWAVTLYWAGTFVAMLLFGERVWRARGECFALFFGFVARLAPLQAKEADRARGKQGCRLRLGWPGAGALVPVSSSEVAFVLLTLATVSFDGFSKTFLWLDAIGINPLEFPGRSAVALDNSIGLAAFWLLLGAAYAGALLLGNRFAGRPLPDAAMLGAFALTVLPISIGYHFSHYLTDAAVNLQYALAALGDPFARGWDLFGLVDHPVSTSFLSTYESVSTIWKLQVAGVVLGHVMAVALAHAVAVDRIGEPRRALVAQMPLSVLMVAYTMFGLWLLAAPTAG